MITPFQNKSVGKFSLIIKPVTNKTPPRTDTPVAKIVLVPCLGKDWFGFNIRLAGIEAEEIPFAIVMGNIIEMWLKHEAHKEIISTAVKCLLVVPKTFAPSATTK